MGTDSKFFTNEDGNTLLERFRVTLADTRFFDVLVGYFKSSGFGLLADSLGKVEKMRILVGMETDKSILDATIKTAPLDSLLASHAEIHAQYSQSVQNELLNAPEDQKTEDSITAFMDFIRAGKIEIRGHPSRDIHAKIYISRYWSKRDFGNVVTGSSNFTNPGLVGRYEFNVQLKDEPDVKFALERFENLWDESVELTEEFLDTATRKTWLNNTITPYELYLKFLYEYFREDINATDAIFEELPENFQNLEYQHQAVIAARKILDAHNGVFLADVVGLGKTYITALLLQGLKGQKLVICPPVLKPYWEKALQDFSVHHFRVVSAGMLESVTDYSRYDYVVADESHRFRNEKTQSYELLKKICLGKKVILLSATPLNNRLEDLLAQIKLFQKGRSATIPGVANLEAFFQKQAKALKELNQNDATDRLAAERISAIVRDKVLKHIMIRRTRKEVSKYFREDIEKNSLTFPEVENPAPLAYEFDDKLDQVFNATILKLKELTYARYTPLLYQKAGPSQIEDIGQKNIRGFIKSLLVKRLESSFHAFGLTVERIGHSYEAFIQAFRKGKVYIGRQVDIGELLESDDLEEMETALSEKGVEIYDSADFAPVLLDDLEKDLAIFEEIRQMWSKIRIDPKYDAFLENLRDNPVLKGRHVLVFTESRETGEYLYNRLQREMPGQALMFSSGGAMYNDQIMPQREARDFIRANFDPAWPEAADDFHILLTTDVLAEGMNLHRAGRVVNYDLPWNPTRVMQRLGRINRIGTTHKKLHIFNFFPTAQADSHLGLQDNITKKISAFNSVLGNDNKILFEEENPDPHGLFHRLSVMAEEEEENSELEYLQEIRNVRDNEPDLFAKIRHLPLKARSAYVNSQFPNELLIFFREGFLKKFIACGSGIRELTFLEAAPLMRAAPDEKRVNPPADYYSRIRAARDFLNAETEASQPGTRLSASARLSLERIAWLQKHEAFTEEEQAYLGSLYKAISQSALAKKTVKRLSEICGKPGTFLQIFNALKQAVTPEDLRSLEREETGAADTRHKPRQIVLCQYLAPAGGNEA